LIEKHLVEVMFVSIGDIANRVKKTFQNEEKTSESTLFEDMKSVELLVLDDLGMEKTTDWLREQLFLIINERYERRLSMIITSNQSLEDI
jgi:DNA replication protein DnaC